MPLKKNDFIIKKNNTLPSLQLTLVDRGCLGGKEPYNLDGVSGVTFTMTNNCGDYKVFSKPASILSVSGGTIQYNWSPSDTNEHGKFLGEFQLMYSDGNIMSIPQNGFLQIEISKNINS